MAVAAYAIQIQMDTHVLENVKVPQFSRDNRTHAKLADLAKAAHRAASRGEEAQLRRIEEDIDRWAGRLWNLTDDELAEIKRSLEEA